MNLHFFVIFMIFSILFVPQRTIRFTAETIDNQLIGGRALAIGDVDGDGKPDILLAEAHRIVWYRNGDWRKFVMADNLNDSVDGLAARDIDGDGIVEIAVSVSTVGMHPGRAPEPPRLLYLAPPTDPTREWTLTVLDQGYAIQQLLWVDVGEGAYQLVVLPKSRTTGDGTVEAENLRTYEQPTDKSSNWDRRIIKQPMPTANNLATFTYDDGEVCYVVGDSGIMGFRFRNGQWTRNTVDWLARGRTLNDAEIGTISSRNTYAFAAFEPGEVLTIYSPGITDSVLLYNTIGRRIIERGMSGGHGLAMVDFLDLERDQVVAGWGKPNDAGNPGIKLYVPFNRYWEAIDVYWIDSGDMACDGLQVADMDNDGKLDIIAFGNTTHNLKIYWNRNE